jgi:hypothetical protein
VRMRMSEGIHPTRCSINYIGDNAQIFRPLLEFCIGADFCPIWLTGSRKKYILSAVA